MVVSSIVPGQGVHEALLNRQDVELRLLDTIRKSLQSKVKCDKEYSSTLLGAVAHGQKVEGDEDFLGSVITQSWKTLLEGFEFLAKLIKQNAESMEQRVLDKLNQLHAEKKKTRKLYLDEYNKMSSQMSKITDDVGKKRVEYQKNLEVFRSLKYRLEEYYVKGGRGSKKIEEIREKYQKTCRKLHQAHNEYVLVLAEATEYEKDFRTLLFPDLLEYHQCLQDDLNQNWKRILEDAAKYSSVCTDQLQDLENRVVKIIEGIRPNEEYGVFSEKISTSFAGSNFLFDESLIAETPGKLLPNQLVVDNLTNEWLKSKLNELDGKIKEEQEKMLKLGECLLNNGKSHESLNKLTSHSELAKKRHELIEMRCDERKLTKQSEMIKFAINELGCEELPSGCELPIEGSLPLNQDDEAGGSISKSLDDLDGESMKSKFSNTISTRKKIISGHFNTLMGHIRRKSNPGTPVLRRSSHGGTGDDRESGPDLRETFGILSSGKDLVNEEWFHGVLPREEVVRLLTHEGDFLVRETTRNDECQTVLSVAWGGHKHFIVQTTPEGNYRFEGPSFPTIQELILYQYKSGLPITSRSGAILKKPILREVWELNNDDVILLDKIGRGNFGDVYKAKLKVTNEEVAVKTCRVALPDENKRKFLQEGRILKQYDHPNIVKLIGICVQKQPIMIVMELVPGGSLLTFLRNNASNLTQKTLLEMCRDTAAGMQYLESRNCIHRDLAARNCLIGYKNMVKISDFGMSREEEEYVVSDGMKQIPIKWTAPEALNFGKYTSLCDVWSYGVLAWEIFARGGVPYPGLSNSKAREKIDSGYRMSAPEGTPDAMYQLMLRCWEYKPESRPHFNEIYTTVNDLCLELFGE
ncbi:hypothetical protein RUM44_005140 [Polyplax serrata]|uniref:Tyrosine-protein kinase n=1 Tax=Polyplax serrata TaxID=468196 RepID=A0ABR1AE67_POLSC